MLGRYDKRRDAWDQAPQGDIWRARFSMNPLILIGTVKAMETALG